MNNVKVPLYTLYFMDTINNRLVKDSVIYNTDVISSSDIVSSTSDNEVKINVPKFRNAIGNENYPVNTRWSEIMHNQTNGSKLYYIVSSNSYNNNAFLDDPIFTPSNRVDETPVYAYSPLFSGYLTNIICNVNNDIIEFSFSGFDWVYKNKLLCSDRSKTRNYDVTDYEYANFSSAYDPPGTITIGSEENPTIVPILTTIIPPGDDQRNASIIEKGSNTILKLKREGLHHLTFNLNLQHNSTNMSTAHMRIYRDVCETDKEEEKEAGKVLLGSLTCELPGNDTATKSFSLDLTEDEMTDIPSIYQKWYREYSLDGKSNVRHFEVWFEVYSNSTVTYSYSSMWASTACWSLDHDQIYNARWNVSVPLRLDETLKTLLGMTPLSIMDSGKINLDDSIIPGQTDYFDDKIIVLDDVQARLEYLSILNSWYPAYNYNRWNISVGDACSELMRSKGVQPVWMTYLYENGKICPDPGSGVSRDVPIETDYTNTDTRYNIKDDYSNHFYTKFGGQSDKPNSQYHTRSETLVQYRNGDGSNYKDPVLLMQYNAYSGTEKNETMTDEDMWNQLGLFNEEMTTKYVSNKFSYIYYPPESMIPDCRIGDRLVSTENSPFQINRTITTISRVCENGNIRWIYKMEGE